ncbi:MAG: response regulator [bacterium]
MSKKENRKVLIIEDDETIGEMYFERVTMEGYATTLIKNGKDGEEAIWNEKPHLVVLDLMLPGKNGVDILETVRGWPSAEKLPIIILTAFPMMGNIEKVNNFNIAGFFSKAEVTPKKIIDEINKILFPMEFAQQYDQ